LQEEKETMAWKPLPEIVEIELVTPQPKEVVLDPKKTAVLVVDMQNMARKNQRSLDVIEGNQRLLEKARAAGVKVMHVQSWRQPESPDHTLFKMPLHLLPGTWQSEIMEELAPDVGESVINKWSNDVWAWYGIEATLEKEGIVSGEWTVVVTGVSAAACAEAASLGFSNRMYRTLVPLDCQAAGVEQESRIFALYGEPEYSNRMGFTLSSMLTFEQPAEEDVPELLIAPTI
jgi:nicotinamidase-related amidase